jgi:hypothetical protein
MVIGDCLEPLAALKLPFPTVPGGMPPGPPHGAEGASSRWPLLEHTFMLSLPGPTPKGDTRRKTATLVAILCRTGETKLEIARKSWPALAANPRLGRWREGGAGWGAGARRLGGGLFEREKNKLLPRDGAGGFE